MSAPKIDTRELGVSLHLVEASHQLQVGVRALSLARQALAGVDGVDEIWRVVEARRVLLEELIAQLNVRAQSRDVQLSPSHSGTGCPMCSIADPLSHPRCASVVGGEQCSGRAHVEGGLCDVCIAEINAGAAPTSHGERRTGGAS